jgi:hypothetical protein
MIQTAVVCDREGCTTRAAWDTSQLTPQNAGNHWLLRGAVANAGWTSKGDQMTGKIEDFCPEHSK